MVEIIVLSLLDTPVRALLAALFLAVVSAALGWWRFSKKVLSAFTRLDERAVSGGLHVYRAPLTRTEISRPPQLARVAALTSYALFPALVLGCLFAVLELLRGSVTLALVSASLVGIGALLLHSAHALVVQGPDLPKEARSRAALSATVAFGAHAALALFLIMIAMGAFDHQSVLVHGIKRMTSVETLYDLRQLLPHKPIFLSAYGHSLLAWQALFVVTLFHACAVLVNASLVRVLLWRIGGQASGASPIEPLSGSRSQSFWSRHGSRVGLAILVGPGLVALAFDVVPPLKARAVYTSIQAPCSLPEMPSGAFDFESYHDISLMSESASVQFRVKDLKGYETSLLASGYEDGSSFGNRVLGKRRTGAAEPSKPDRHFELRWPTRSESDHFDTFTTCNVYLDTGESLVTIKMWSGD